ncbi:MAG: fibronectin type III domain-containing protein [Bacteroidales bacterium]|nr:fibronectin type III domain-containing protein [Bacteroidales bacterium]
MKTRRILLLLALIVAVLAPQTTMRAQTFGSSYTFTTGLDVSKWRPITGTPDGQMLGSVNEEDDWASDYIQIGFPFTFAGQVYTLWQYNTNGMFMLGDDTDIDDYTGYPVDDLPNVPCITVVGFDGYFTYQSYCKWQVQGTAGNRVLVIEYKNTSYNSRDDDDATHALYQLQFAEADNSITMVFPSDTNTNVDLGNDYQTGIGVSARDRVYINTLTHQMVTAQSALYLYNDYDLLPGHGRYYKFTYNPNACWAQFPTLSSVGGDSVVVSWQPVPSASSYWVNIPGVASQSTTGTSMTVHGLASAHGYELTLGTICLNGTEYDTSSTQTIFSSGCDPVALPYYNNFANYETGTLPGCFRRVVNTSYPTVVSNATYSADNTNVLRTYTTATTTNLFQMPAVEMPLSGLALSFTYSASTINGMLEVGYLTTAGDQSTFVVAGTYTPIVANRRDTLTFNIPAGTLAGQTVYPAVRQSATANTYGYIDNLTYTESTVSCFPPVGCNVTLNVLDTVRLTWSGTPDHSFYEVCYSKFNNVDSAQATARVTNTTNIELNGLDASTRYYVWYRAYCGVDAGDWQLAATVVTPCGTVRLPYEENFDTWGTGTTIIPNCWTKVLVRNNYPYINSQSSYNISSPNVMVFYTNSTANSGSNMIAMPGVRMDGPGIRVRYMISHSRTTVVMTNGYVTDPTDVNTFVPISTYTPATTYARDSVVFYIPSDTIFGRVIYPAVRQSNSSGTSLTYGYMDNWRVTEMSSCSMPQDVALYSVMDNSVTIKWRMMPYALWYDIRINTTNNISTATTYTTFDTSIVIPNLTQQTAYYAWVRANCGTDSSEWVSVNFTTPCSFYTLPVFENFESYTTGTSYFPNCWTKVLVNGNYPYLYSLTTAGRFSSGSQGLRCYPTASLPNMIATNGVLYPDCGLVVKYRFSVSSTTYSMDVESGYMINPQDINTFVVINTSHTPTSTYALDSIKYYISDNTLSGRAIYPAIRIRPTGSVYCYIDDFQIDSVNGCIPATNLAAGPIRATEATLTWTESSQTQIYNVRYSTVNDVTTGTDIPVVGSSHVITGLTPNTTYYAWVAADCGGATSSWTNAVTFTTECSAVQLPYAQGFESYSTGVMPECWSRIKSRVNGSNTFPQIYSTGTHSGSRALRFYPSTADSTMAATPYFDAPGNSLHVSFYAHVSSTTTSNGPLQVGIMTDRNDFSTFIPVLTVPVTASLIQDLDYDFHTTDLSVTDNVCVAFLWRGNNAYCYIDDVVVETSNGCVRPLTINVSNVRPDSATIAWNAPAGFNGDYEVRYGTTNNVDATSNMTITTQSNSLVLTNLMPLSTYYVWVRSVCAPGVESNWSRMSNFTTICPSTLCSVFVQGFDSNEDGWDGGAGVSVYQNNTNLGVITFSEGASATMAYNNVCATYPLELRWHQGPYDSEITFRIMDRSGVEIYPLTSADLLDDDSLLITMLQPCDQCAAPMGIAADYNSLDSTISISWDTTSAIGYIVRYRVSRTYMTSDDFRQLIVRGGDTVLNSILPGIVYELQMASICAPGDTSGFAVDSVNTSCGLKILTAGNRIVENFDREELPLCWQVVYADPYPTERNMVIVTNEESYNGNYSLRFSSYDHPSTGLDEDQKQYFISQPIMATDTVFVSYYYMGSNDQTDSITVGYSTTSNNISAFTWMPMRAGRTSWRQASETFPANTKYVAFKFNGIYAYDLYVDSIVIESNGLLCSAPRIAQVNHTYNSVDISWTTSASSVEYVFVQGAFDADRDTAYTASTNNTVSFNGLTSNTTYTFAVRSICGPGIQSTWTTQTITTDDLPCFPPTQLQVTNTSYQTATLDWTAVGSETAWQLRVTAVSGGVFDSTYSATTHPFTIGGLNSGVTYSVIVRAMCGSTNEVEGSWSDTPVQFTTEVCQPVTFLTVSNITSSTATVSWTAPNAQSNQFELNWGYSGFPVGSGSLQTVTGTTYTITGLTADVAYEVYVRNLCTGDIYSNWSAGREFTTAQGGNETYYTITVNSNDNTMGSVSGGGRYLSGTTTYIVATPNAGYHFVQWNDGNQDASRLITVTTDSTFTATFAVNTYTLTVHSADSTMGNVSGSGTFAYGTPTPIVANAVVGHEFVQWNDGNTDNPRTVLVMSDTSFTASFARSRFTITTTTNDNTMGVTFGDGTYNYGDSATLIARANVGFHLLGWNDGNVDTLRRVQVVANATYTATFISDSDTTVYYTIVAVPNDASMGTVTGGGVYASGTVITLNATANDGFLFTGWSNGQTTASIQITVTQNDSLTAIFDTIRYVITVEANDNTMGTVIGGGTYARNSIATLTAIPNSGFSFQRWSTGQTDSVITVTVTDNATYTAYFTRNEGIEQADGIFDLVLYPNPASSVVNIAVEGMQGNAEMMIMDLNGRIVERRSVAQAEIVQVDVNNYAQGTYFVRISNGQQSAMRKLIVR